jgi:hypothetical protein
VARVLAGVVIVQSFAQLNGNVIKAVGKPSWRLGIAMLQSAATALAILAVVRSGIVQVAIATLAAGIVLFPVGFWAVRRLVGIEPGRYLAQFVGPLLAVAPCVAAALGTSVASESLAVPLRIALSIGAGATAYGIGLRLAAPALLRRIWALAGDALPGRLRARAPGA